MNEIKLIQAPIIKHELEAVGKSIDQRLAGLNIEGQVATEETVQSLKKLRTELNSELKEYEEQRKTVKNAVLEPYNTFDAEYKIQVSDKMVVAISLLKDKIAEVEYRIKADKMEEIKEYFVELCLSEDIDFLSVNQIIPSVGLTVTAKKYKEQVLEFVSKVKDELLLISTQANQAEILVLYKKTLNAAKAIKEVQDRKQAEKAEVERIQMVRTHKRTQALHGITFVSMDITRTYNWVRDNKYYITMSDIENLSDEDFRKVFNELKAVVEDSKEPIQVPAQAPLQAPKAEVPKAELLTATFQCTGTMEQLTELGKYMKSNNITFKNI